MLKVVATEDKTLDGGFNLSKEFVAHNSGIYEFNFGNDNSPSFWKIISDGNGRSFEVYINGHSCKMTDIADHYPGNKYRLYQGTLNISLSNS